MEDCMLDDYVFFYAKYCIVMNNLNFRLCKSLAVLGNSHYQTGNCPLIQRFICCRRIKLSTPLDKSRLSVVSRGMEILYSSGHKGNDGTMTQCY